MKTGPAFRLDVLLAALACLTLGCGPTGGPSGEEEDVSSSNEDSAPSIVIGSNPPGASVSLDGARLGTTHLSLALESIGLDLESMSGSSTISLVQDGYHPEDARIVLRRSSLEVSGSGLESVTTGRGNVGGGSGMQRGLTVHRIAGSDFDALVDRTATESPMTTYGFMFELTPLSENRPEGALTIRGSLDLDDPWVERGRTVPMHEFEKMFPSSP